MTAIRIDSLRVAQLSNTHFRCYGLRLQRLELLAERDCWRLSPLDIYETLALCPNLEHLTLCMVLQDVPDVTAADAYQANSHIVLDLQKLRCFILEDGTNECLVLLSALAFPGYCDFHWTAIEPFGNLGYYTQDLRDNLTVCAVAFNDKTSGASTPSVLVIETVLDFEGEHVEPQFETWEWPEEIRVTFASDEDSAMAQFVTRHPTINSVDYRDFSVVQGSPRRSFGVRSKMLSKKPQDRNQRHRPKHYAHAAALNRTPADMPRLHGVISQFMAVARTLRGFSEARSVIVPPHAYKPQEYNGWRLHLMYCPLMTKLTIGSVDNAEEPRTLAGYLARRQGRDWPHALLADVHCPRYEGPRGRWQHPPTRDEFEGLMDFCSGDRRGCVDITWHAPLLQ